MRMIASFFTLLKTRIEIIMGLYLICQCSLSELYDAENLEPSYKTKK